MKLGFETVLYGRFPNLEHMFWEIAEAGYQGVEIAQSPAMLKASGVSSLSELRQILKQCGNLELAGMAGGTLKDRLEYIGDAPPPDYLYIDSWDDEYCTKAEAMGIVLALHPHAFMPIHRMRDAFERLKTHPLLQLCPDSAHLTLLGEDPVKAITDHASRLAAVHLKDWIPQFGRHSHRYARGFVELGEGIVKLEAVVKAAQEAEAQHKRENPLWLILEIDSTRTTSADALRRCGQWISNHGFTLAPKKRYPEAGSEAPTSELNSAVNKALQSTNNPQTIDSSLQLRFYRRLTEAATKGSNAFYGEVVEALAEVLPVHLVQLWIYTPSERRFDLAAYTQAFPGEQLTEMSCLNPRSAPLCGSVISSLITEWFDLSAGSVDRVHFRDKLLLGKLDEHGNPCMITIPVCNTWNAHHMRFIFNVFPKLENVTFADVISNKESKNNLLRELTLLADAAGRAADSMLDERCISACGLVQRLNTTGMRSEVFANHLVQTTKIGMDCEAVALFTVDPLSQRLSLAASAVPEGAHASHTIWNTSLPASEHYYRPDDKKSKTVTAWQYDDIYFQSTEESRARIINNERRSWEPLTGTNTGYEAIFAPIHSRTGSVIGVIRCSQKVSRPRRDQPLPVHASPRFTDDDSAILDAITQVAAPFLEIVTIQRQQLASMGLMTHEMLVPLTATHYAIDIMRGKLANRHIAASGLFGQDYIEDIQCWMDILQRQVTNADVFRQGFQPNMPLNKEETLLYRDVFAPAVRQIRLLVDERDLSHRNIELVEMTDIPPFSVDKSQLQQVVFNLLSNSIKYATSVARNFRVRISASLIEGSVIIRFEDYGIGIPDDAGKYIFDAGFRGEEAKRKHVAGQGFGLAVCRAIIAAHGGTIELRRNRNPTIFQIILPVTHATIRQTGIQSYS
jgi:signal transduction histidine kinase/sugar phosphate isomerase/epimerase